MKDKEHLVHGDKIPLYYSFVSSDTVNVPFTGRATPQKSAGHHRGGRAGYISARKLCVSYCFLQPFFSAVLWGISRNKLIADIYKVILVNICDPQRSQEVLFTAALVHGHGLAQEKSHYLLFVSILYH